uniref:Coiled-coil serine-rich protein 1 n=1 Tax=Oryzias melastigma TaxID=30732 RepID=A0A3B3CUG3_ORYME
MGESGSRRSTLVSRLPIFRRSNSKRQESLPSSPSSGGVGNGVHTSSPSSTNSSSGSTGKRRSLFRTPSLGFTSKRNNDPPVQPINLNLPQPQTQTTDANGNNQPTVTPSASTRFNDGGGRPKSRHSFGFGSHKQKKIPRSQTEDFDKASSSSSSANRNVFINCISSSGTNEGDDSGFLDDYSGGSNNNRRSSRQKKQLLPKSFSAHHRFSRTSDHHRPPEVNLEPSSSTTVAPGTGGLTPGSWPGELIGPGGESSLQSPMISEDRTTAITPSEFVPATEDSVSEVDPALPADPASPEPPPAQENISAAVTTSQVFFSPVQSSTEKPLLPDTSTANNTDYDTAVSLSEPETAVPCLPLQEQSQEEREEREEERQEAQKEELTENKSDLVNERKPCLLTCLAQSYSFFLSPASLCSSASPYHEVMRMERRLRSSSEGAGGPRIHGNQSDAPGMEGCGLLKHRNNSSSSKMGSLDVLNNLGSSELDEDDLMLDLDYSDDQRHRHVSREDSSQSLTSCLNLLPSPMDASGDRIPGKEGNQREPSRPTSLLPAEWSMGLGLSKEEELLPSGLEALPFRLMQQDCTAVKTLLLRLRRTLQESTETSPASSLQSLPISPCSEKSLPFKHHLCHYTPLHGRPTASERHTAREERHSQPALTQSAVRNPVLNFAPGPSKLSTAQASPTTSPQLQAFQSSPNQLPESNNTAPPLCSKQPEAVSSSSESLTPEKGPGGSNVHIPRSVGASTSSSLHSLTSKASSSSFTGRLGQPPRGPLSLHSYSRKNVFLQHSLHTAELQALTQRDS